MALAAGSLVFVAYPKADPLGTPAGTLTKAYMKSVTVEDNGIGRGSFAIHPDEAQAAWCTQDDYIAVWRDTVSGDPIAGFWVDAIGKVIDNPEEEGGKLHGVTGNGPIAYLKEARVWPKAVSGASGQVRPAKGDWHWTDIHPARALVRLLEEAVARGCLPGVTWDFTRTLDSDGNPWSVVNADDYTVSIGTTYLDVVRELRETGLHITMDGGLVVHAWDSYDNDLSATIGFTSGVDIRDTAEAQVASRRGVSAVIVEGENKQNHLRYRIRHDDTIETALGRRKEGFFRFTRTATASVLNRVGDRKLRKWKKQYDGPFVLPVLDTTGKVALVDYTVGDTIAVPTDYVSGGTERIAAITLTDIENGEYDPALEMGDLAPDPVTGDTPSRDIEGAGCCGDTPGAGKKPGGGGGGGGSDDPVDETGETPLLYLEDFGREIAIIATAETQGVLADEHTIDLPAGIHVAKRRLGMVMFRERGSGSSVLITAMEAAGFTHIDGDGWVPGARGGEYDVFDLALTGLEGYAGDGTDQLVVAATDSVVHAVAYCLERAGAPVMATTSGNDPPSLDPGIETSTPTLWLALVADDGAVSGDPSGYTNVSSGEAGTFPFHWRLSQREGDATPDDPSAYTGGEMVATIAIQTDPTWLDDALGYLPVQVDTAAWWPGGNEWSSFFAGFVGDHGIEDGVFFAESAATHETSGNNWTISVFGEGHPSNPGPVLPMEAGDFELEIRYRLRGAKGEVADAGLRYLYFDWMFSGRLQLNFGDGTNAEGIQVIGETTDTATMTLPDVDEYGLIRWRWQDGMVYGKVWADADDMPVAWPVSAAVDSDLDLDDVEFDIVGRLGNASGPVQRIEIDYIRVVPLAEGGDSARRVIAHGDGTGPFSLGEAFVPGTLRVWVDDIPVTPATQDPTTGAFTLATFYHDASNHAAGCSKLVVEYQVA
jgi:hypothetical protein